MTDAVPQGQLPRAPRLELADRATLEGWIRARLTPQRTVLRSRIVLLLAEGLSAREVARRLGISRHTVDLWRGRYAERGCDVLTKDKPGRGRKRTTNGEFSLCPGDLLSPAFVSLYHPPENSVASAASTVHTKKALN